MSRATVVSSSAGSASVSRKPYAPAPAWTGEPEKKPRPEADILFQKFFKSVGPRTYAAQLKRAGNGNHFLVLTEGKREKDSTEVRKTRLFVFSEDFPEFFRMLQETAQFIKANPVPPEVKERQDKFWAKTRKAGPAASGSRR